MCSILRFFKYIFLLIIKIKYIKSTYIIAIFLNIIFVKQTIIFGDSEKKKISLGSTANFGYAFCTRTTNPSVWKKKLLDCPYPYSQLKTLFVIYRYL